MLKFHFLCSAKDFAKKVFLAGASKRKERLRPLVDLAIKELFENGTWLVHLGHARQDFNPFDVLR